MKKLIKMINEDRSAEEIAQRAKMLSENGLLQDYIDKQGDISELSLLCRENAEMIVGKWEQAEPTMWIRREDADTYSAVIVYSGLKGYYMLYRFEILFSEYDKSVLAEYEKACPPPDSILNRKIRELYSLFMSLPLSRATDKCATSDAEIKTLWLKRLEIVGGQVMIYCCDACRFLFEGIGEVKQCPDCGKKLVREATEEEKEEYKRLKEEFQQ